MAGTVPSLCSFGFVHTESLLPKGPFSKLAGLAHFESESLKATNVPKCLITFQFCLHLPALSRVPKIYSNLFNLAVPDYGVFPTMGVCHNEW